MVAGSKVKILGIGGEVKLGVSKELINASLSNGVQYGGEWKLDAALGAGPLGIRSSNLSLEGNIFFYEANMDVSTFSQRITLLDLNAYFGIGGSLKVYMNINRTLMPSRPDPLPGIRIDNTYVAPTYYVAPDF